jgi:hypothetical protein
MRRHYHSPQVGELGDPRRLGDPTDITWIRTNDTHRIPLDQFLEILPQVITKRLND